MDVGPLVVHVLDPVLGLVVLHPRARHLAAHPSRLAAGEGVARRLLAKHTPIVFRADAVIMGSADTRDGSLPDRQAISLELGEARPKARVDIFVQHLCGRVDMGIGIVHAESVFHIASPPAALTLGPS